jgi:SAM-dependent methyltransferase
MRQLVGPTEREHFDNPSGDLIYPYLEEDVYRRVFDFGCGCGRVARQLLQQRVQPERYLGVDLHRDMVQWCRANIAPRAERFEFEHHDVHNVGFNPRARSRMASLPASDRSFTMVNAWSVFTHLIQDQAEFYLREVARILEPHGAFHATWFFMDKRYFPMMQEFQNALYINTGDPSNAVIFDREWVCRTAADAGLVPVLVKPPAVRGYAWIVVMKHRREGVTPAEFPPDEAPFA